MFVDFIAGLLGGATGVLVGHPFDTVKVHLQMDDPKNPKYKGTLHCMKTILLADNVRGLYRGISSPMMGIGAVNSIVFGIYGNVQRLSSDPNALMTHCYAGAAAGVAQSFVCAPMELAKTRLQLAKQIDSQHKFKGPLDCLLFIIRTQGLKAIFKGLGATILRDIPGFAGYFVSYEYLISLKEQPSVPYTLVAGGCAGMASWLTSYPFDVVKTKLQADSLGAKAQYNGFMDCAIKNLKNEGPRFFFRGLNSTLIRAFPMNAACFFVVSWVLHFCKTHGIDNIENSNQPLKCVKLDNTGPYIHNELKADEVLVRRIVSENELETNESMNESSNGNFIDYYHNEKIYESKIRTSQINIKDSSNHS